MLGVRAILDFCRNDYDKPYAENSRESFRKETLHQFVAGGLALQNPDDPGRLTELAKVELSDLAGSKWAVDDLWDKGLGARRLKKLSWKAVETLANRYKKERDMNLVPCSIPDGKALATFS